MRRQILNAADAGEGDAVANQLRGQMASEPSDVSLRLALAAHYAKIGLPELQLELLRVAVERFPASREARLTLAEALRAAGQPRQAIESLRDFAQGYPASADAVLLNRLGVCYDEAGDWKSGEQAYRRALDLSPRLDYLHNNLGYNLLEQQRLAEAVTEFHRALRINPDSMVARNNLGVTLARLSLRDPNVPINDALKHFENIVDAATAYNNLAAALIEENRYEQSRWLLEAALDYNRSHAAALANLRLVSELDGKPAEWHLRPRRHFWSRSAAALKRVFASEQPLPNGPTERPNPDRAASEPGRPLAP